jgi:serpin B
MSLVFACALGCETLPSGPDDTADPAAQDCEAPANTRAAPSTDAAAAAAVSNTLGLSLLRMADADAILSPLSVTTAVGLTLGGAEGGTADEIRTMLGITDDASFHAGIAELSATLAAFSSDGTGACPTWQFDAGNDAFVADRLPLSDAYSALLADPYGITPESVDFGDPVAAADTINTWAGDVTHGRITDLADPADFDASTVLVLANAVWFYGPWTDAFDPDDTSDGPFTRADGSAVTVPLMRGTAPRGIAWLSGATLVELPYRGNDVSMVLLVPDDPAGLDAALAAFDPAAFDTLGGGSVEVILPRFEARQRVSLKDALASLGMPSAFDPTRADLSGIPAPDAPVGDLYVDDVFHSAWISVDEAGTEAAAATEVVMSDTGSIPEQVRADHPFAYFVRDRESGVVLFAGRVDDPS